MFLPTVRIGTLQITTGETQNSRFCSSNDPEFARHLASFGEVYVDEAFSVAHRLHASIVGIPVILPSFIGPAFNEEISNLSKVFNPPRPFLFVIGGAKFETKIPLLHKFLDSADRVGVMGALANDFFKAQGLFLGDSDVSPEIPKEVYEMQKNPKIILPTDVVSIYKGEKSSKLPTQIGLNERIVDTGDKTVRALKSIANEAGFILWNGPLGKSDTGYAEGTENFAKAIALSKKPAIVGGGDVVAAIEKLNIMKKFTFVSSGGGAMLTFLSDETLVGLDAVKNAGHKVAPSNCKKSFWQRIFG
jgi:phosphoglycerate kinase